MEDTTPNHVPNTPNLIPNTTPELTPNITSNITLNTTPIELKSPKKEDDDEPLTQKRKPTRTSDVWEHFTKIKGGNPNNPRCVCKYCGANYACPSSNGTSSLWAHFKKCKKNLKKVLDKKQQLLSFKKEKGGASNLLAVTFNKVRCRNVLAKFVVKDEKAFKVVEGEGFKELVQELQPMFVVPSRVTIARDVHHLYFKERAKLMEVLTTTGQRAFSRYEEEDDKFVSYFMEQENGKKRIGPPIPTDWQAASIFVKFLATFYEVTLKFSSTLHVTSNNFYHEICEVHTILSDLASSRDPLLSSMAGSMKRKYNKYLGNPEDINPLLFIAVVLDPRYKMKYLKYCFESIYNVELVATIVMKVESLLQRLYVAYVGDGEASKVTIS
ncbi:hypothetical protein POM88_008190 [Heracleum sosnowskyi]|uniref:BED-type domain-containing protein n=1 Tax=Heracleum sosnowskyi TaxID=360622 RepID=A0AAD8N707_9APIA|nr:hypothetical protein POM88_008190 [Heracleum sosnowskyi]